jgi:hypothetical protein
MNPLTNRGTVTGDYRFQRLDSRRAILDGLLIALAQHALEKSPGFRGFFFGQGEPVHSLFARPSELTRRQMAYNSNVRLSGFVQSRCGVFPASVDDPDKEDSLSNFIVRKAAVLGAGVMGAQIAAHLANAEVPVVLFDLPAKEGDPNGIVRKAIDALKKLEPSPLATQGSRRLHRRRQLLAAPRSTQGLRSDHRSHRREDRVERRSLSPDRALHRARRDHRFEHLGPVDQPPVGRFA